MLRYGLLSKKPMTFLIWILAIFSSALFAGCGGGVLDAINQAPVAVITSPTDGETLLPGTVTLGGYVDDFEENDLSDLRVTWVATGNSREHSCKSTPTDDGSVSCTLTLDPGDYSLTLTVLDGRGAAAVARADFHLENGLPQAEIQGITGQLESDGLVQFKGVVSDPEDLPSELDVVWSSSRDGELGSSVATSDGKVSFEAEGLSPGTHVIRLTVTDTLGASSADEKAIDIAECVDEDEDGFNTCESGGNEADCNDFDGTVYPDAEEACDGVDNDCDDKVDEGYDQDGDGYVICDVGTQPADCNDKVWEINPGASEKCNEVDDNCNGVIDEETDSDNDGITNCDGDCDDSNPLISPELSEVCDGLDNDCDDKTDEGFDQDNDGVTSCNNDCDDTNGSINPGARETCNQIDDNCNGEVDEGFDIDGDGYSSCGSDCNDTDEEIHTDASERCNGQDDDCDGLVDEDFDQDGDGYSSCADDCDDTRANVHPSATEVCDGYDNNCDTEVDENFDHDGDGYTTCQNDCNDSAVDVNPGQEELCNGRDDDCNDQVDEDFDLDLDGVTTCEGDCDDGDAEVNPSATEVCNGKDDDCDTVVDDEYDQDGDGFTNCEGDCNDTDADINPTATEVCDGTDNDCDGKTDEGVKTSYYADMDLDTYGSSSNSTQACSKPTGYVSNSSDCDDTDASVFPGAAEGSGDANDNGVTDGDGVDNDCDGTIDEGTDRYDDDQDGYTENEGDCDDSDSLVYPDAPEGPDSNNDGQLEPDNVDNDCDGQVDESTEAFDDDGDGQTELEGDCDDANDTVFEGADEFFDGLDNDCDGLVESEINLVNSYSYVGAQSGSRAGFSLGGEVDVNGDGFDDLIVGSPRYNARRGAVHVVFGRQDFSQNQSLATGSVTFEEDAGSSQTGYAVTGAGDLDGDGYDDFGVGAPYKSSGNLADAGAAYIVFGRPSGWTNGSIATYAEASIAGLYTGSYLGTSIAGGADINGNGFDDLVIGSPWPTSSGAGAGWITVVPGKSANWTQNMALSTLCKITGNGSEGIGRSVAVLPRGNSDGFGDIVAGGQYNLDEMGDAWFVPGASALMAGSSYGPSDVGGSRFYGQTNAELVGDFVSNAGDVNGDGYDDFLVGRQTDGNGTDAKAYLYYGPSVPNSGTAQGTADTKFYGASSDHCPCTVAGIGDLDADGFDDIAIGMTTNSEGAGGGKIYLFYGRSSDFASSVSLSTAANAFYGEASEDQAGLALSEAGDLNGDGYGDFAIGAPYNDVAGIDGGKVYLLFGFPRE